MQIFPDCRCFYSALYRFHGNSLKSSCFSLSISLQAVVFDGEEQAFQSVMNGKASFTLYHNMLKRACKTCFYRALISCRNSGHRPLSPVKVANLSKRWPNGLTSSQKLNCAENDGDWKTDSKVFSQVHASRNRNHFSADISGNVWDNTNNECTSVNLH